MKPLIVVLTLALAACGSTGSAQAPTTQAPTGPDPLTQIAQFTIADLQAADMDAVAHNDAISHACYPALIRFVSELQGNIAGATVKGAFSAFQRARDLRLGYQSGLPVYLKLGCAALVQDETALLIKLGAIGAGAAIVGPLAPAAVAPLTPFLP